MTTIKKTNKYGYDVYKFIANGTSYEVLTLDGIEFTVWSHRLALTHCTPPTVYSSLNEMAKRSKALKGLATLISA